MWINRAQSPLAFALARGSPYHFIFKVAMLSLMEHGDWHAIVKRWTSKSPKECMQRLEGGFQQMNIEVKPIKCKRLQEREMFFS